MKFLKILKRKRVVALLVTAVLGAVGVAAPPELVLPIVEIVTELF